ncbi:EDD domain-containing protein, DegV family [Mycolicibacterium conceptionense]|uniref:EDD domain-containing protein, DegV family n=1 Tax=Mycolicibacterium conceptionense TaxID=451644 RepID=A0A0U1DVN7_9MYCO|nr:EDD domain-containing protein, DegV family [Mycolicibacterium conceptionense]
MAVMVVTDSTSRLRPELCEQWGIRQVPLHILDDGADLRDGVDEMPPDIYDRPRVTTSGASPADLADIYRQALADSGGDGVVAVHISAALSGTYSTAAATAREVGPAVRVVNSRAAAMGGGLRGPGRRRIS